MTKGTDRVSYTYLMRKSKKVTIEKICGKGYKIIDINDFSAPVTNKFEKRAMYGRMQFEDELNLWDAMEAGLVPTFCGSNRKE